MKKRWFNYRPIFLVFIFLLLGSLFAFYVNKFKIISIICFSLLFILVLVIAIIKRNLKYILVPIISFILSVSVYNLSVNSFNKSIDFTPNIIQARVYLVDAVNDGAIKVKADSVSFDGEKVNTNLSVYIYDKTGLFTDIKIGSVINFKPLKFYKSDLEFNSNIPNAKMYASNLKYSVTCSIEDLNVTDFDRTFAEDIKLHIKENLSNGLTNENVEIAYAALFGDKAYLSDGQYSAYRLSGVAHLLAVSGLHISIIVAIVSKIFSLCKVKGWPKFIIIAIFLVLYSILCDFSVSVLRASIMSLMVLLASLLGKEYDPLSSLGLAGIIVFLMNPLCIFDISFLMSFGCVLGIIMFTKPFTMLFVKLKFPKKVAESLAVSISTLLTLMVISAYFFKNFNLISIIANMLIIPIFVVAFSIVFVVSLVSTLIPVSTVVLTPLNYVFDFINLMATILGNLHFANLTTTQINFIAIPIYFCLLLIFSRICMAKRINKMIISIPILAILLLCVII